MINVFVFFSSCLKSMPVLMFNNIKCTTTQSMSDNVNVGVDVVLNSNKLSWILTRDFL